MEQQKLLFAVGPVQMHPETLAAGAEPLPYFRTADFSRLMLRAEENYLRLLSAPEGSRAVFLSSSGTGGMDAMVSCILSDKDHALVVNGGGFGQRFCELCQFYGVRHSALSLRPGQALSKAALEAAYEPGMTALLVNLHETSTGTLYDLSMLRDFCKSHGMLLLIDAVSAFLCEEIPMDISGADAVLTASQKALACAPGIALLALSERAQQKIADTPQKNYYLNLSSALNNGLRGQPPFTIAESVMLQVAHRLEQLQNGGMEQERRQMRQNAGYFRTEVQKLPFTMLSESPALGCTALCTREGVSAHELFLRLMDHYDICICPNGGELRDKVFRVGHMGCLAKADYDMLLSAFEAEKRRGRI